VAERSEGEEIRVERTMEEKRTGYRPPEMDVRDDDLEPHAGLRYIARMFKVLAVLLVLLLLAEIILGIYREGSAAIPTLLVEATRLIVMAGFLWGAGDLALMLIESNHDLRATRILVGRLNGRVTRLEETATALREQALGRPGSPGGAPPAPPPPPRE
jgi:hypothetical protein